MQIDIFDIDGNDLLMKDPVPPCPDIQPNIDEEVDYYLINCDHVWDEAGELAQKAFEDYTRKTKKHMICYQQEEITKEPEIKCISLLKWIEENVEIV
jgi:hypothetical protein